MPDRNTTVGIFFITAGAVVAGLGYIGAQNVPIAAFGFSLFTIGALILLIVPESIPKDAYMALFKDSISNIEIVLEESQLKEKAYFVPTGDGEIRAVIPLSKVKNRGDAKPIISSQNGSVFLETLKRAPSRFITNFGGLQALVLIPPGNEIVKLSKAAIRKNLDYALNRALISFSDLAGSVRQIEDVDGKIKIQIRNAKLGSEFPYFKECLGSPVSCVASCVLSAVKGLPVQIVEEIYDPALVRLTVKVLEGSG